MKFTEALNFYLKRKVGVSTPTDSEEARAEACAIEALVIMAEKESAREGMKKERKFTKPTPYTTVGKNTWCRDIDDGQTQEGPRIKTDRTITVWFTSEPGEKEQLSLGDLAEAIRIRVPFDKLEETIKEARKEREKRRN